MIDVDEEIIEIRKCSFFSSLGVSETVDSTLIYIGSVKEAFVEPSVQAFEGLYNDVEWLPSSPNQPDPFYNLPKPPSDLVAMRMKINKVVLAATNSFDKSRFRCAPHDFSVVARNAVCFAFRQYMSEQYYGLGDQWARIVTLYGKGHWPVGFCENKLVVI